ncbi:hypothetical protein SUNI508_03876 [Seiridium unicorne]|uniref:VASt domain-containing protein n=1 Tax=Seiridium unicorne TaxID=138068 RepID=A0ABR2VAC4_9PEZI
MAIPSTITMPMELVHPALREPGTIVDLSVDFLGPAMITYAFERFRYVLSPKEVHDIFHEGWEGWYMVDRYVSYMRQADSELSLQNMANYTPPASVHTDTDDELDQTDLTPSPVESESAETYLEPLPIYTSQCVNGDAMLGLYCPPSFTAGHDPPDYTVDVSRTKPLETQSTFCIWVSRTKQSFSAISSYCFRDKIQEALARFKRR